MDDQPMVSAEQQLGELGFTFNPEMPYDLESMFLKRAGWGAKGEVKRKQKLVLQVEGLLGRMLKPEERVLYVAQGVQNKFSEQFFMGIWAMMINQTVFVLTNLRLIMLHTDTKGRPRHTYWMIYYSQIKKFKGGWTGQVALDLVDSTKLRFTGFRGIDRKQMPAIFERTFADYQQLGFDPAATQSRENLCSQCLVVVPKDQYDCHNCGQRFWRPSEIALRSLAFPSWGDFLMGHTSFAVVELLGYAITWLILVGVIIASFGDPEGPVTVAVVLVILLLWEHAMDAGLTYFIAKKGLTPRGGGVTFPAEGETLQG